MDICVRREGIVCYVGYVESVKVFRFHERGTRPVGVAVQKPVLQIADVVAEFVERDEHAVFRTKPDHRHAHEIVGVGGLQRTEPWVGDARAGVCSRRL